MTQLSIFNRPSPLELIFDELPREGDPDGLRYYQRTGLGHSLAALERVMAVLVVMATGTGKTRLFRTLAKYSHVNILVLAHRDELINQAVKELQGLGELIGVEKADVVSSAKHRIVVGSVQSLNPKRLARLGPDRFQLIIVDEAHHSTATSYQRIFQFFKAKRFGVTATPNRGDKQALGKVYDEVAFVFDIEDGIEAGYLVPIRGRRVVLDTINLDDLKKQAGDLPAGALDEVMAVNVNAIVDKTLELEPTRTAICFFPGVKSAELAANRFNHIRPGSAAFVSGFTNTDERAGIMAAFKQGRIKYLCNCGVATEGFDAPNASLVVLARPTLSHALYCQMIGRGGRVLPDVVDRFHGEAFAKERREAIANSRKPDMMILDFVGNSQKHDLVTPLDVLGGKYSDAEVKEAKKHIKSGANVQEALAEARAKLRQLAERPAGQLKSVVHNFDPFAILGLSIRDDERYAGRFGSRNATPPQVSRLASLGFKQDDLNQLSFRGAKKLLDRCDQRKTDGLCSYRQLAILQRHGITETELPIERATAALEYIATKEGWPTSKHGRAKMGPIDPKALHDIVHYQRAAGED